MLILDIYMQMSQGGLILLLIKFNGNKFGVKHIYAKLKIVNFQSKSNKNKS